MDRNFVTDRLAIGRTPETAEDLSALISDGVTHIVDCRIECDIGAWLGQQNYHGYYLFAGTEDWTPLAPTHKPLEWFQKGLEFVLPALALPRYKAYVCCHLGANRSATMGWAILRALGITPGDCYAIIGSHRPIDIFGLPECGWWRDAEVALKTLGYL